MNQTRWQQIEHLYHAALEHAPGERTNFINDECAGDEELCAELESLLSTYEQVGDFLAEKPISSRFHVSATLSLNSNAASP